MDEAMFNRLHARFNGKSDGSVSGDAYIEALNSRKPTQKTTAPPARPAAAAAPPAPVRAIPNVQPTHTQGRGLMNALKVLKTRSGGY